MLHGLPTEPRTVRQWRALVAAGGDPLPELDRCRAAALRRRSAGEWITLADDDAWREQIDRLDRRLGESPDRAELVQRYPLLGVPFAVKDNIDVAGTPTTAACPAFAYRPGRSATVVQRLLDAGAVWVGKTNLDQFATGLVGTRSPYGRPASVFDGRRISGGSSSGSAVAVARGEAAFALGTDTAGSGRVPAAFNALVGLKPTPGRLSTAGVVPACRTIDCVSLFTHGVDDAALLLALAEGPDPADPYSDFRTGPARLPQPLRVGIPKSPAFFGDAGYGPAFAAATERLAALGHAVVEVDFALLHEVAALLYEGPWVAERQATVGRLIAEAPQALDPAVRRVIERAAAFTAADAFRAQYRLRELRQRACGLWQRVDLLMVPTVPGHPTFDEVDADPLGVNSALGTYTNFVNLLGWCAVALPAGSTAAGLPFGVSFIGPGAHDAALLRFARGWAEEGDADAAAPRPAALPTLPIAVVGAHLAGLPLNGQLTERGAWLREATRTAPDYRLYALPDTRPPKPGLQRVAVGGASIEVEVWELPIAEVGSFLALVPAPLGIGSVELADGRRVHGFLCESHALAGARDISALGGWRAYLASL